MSQFSIPLGKLAEKVNVSIELLVQKTTYDLFRKVVLKSPVDTGRFRANWNVSEGTPDESTTHSIDSNRGQQEAQKALTYVVGGTVYMINALPYARRLEYGYSQQAPEGMVRLSVIELKANIDMAVA